MPTVPQQFWTIDRAPAPAPVTSVTPTRIYVAAGDEGVVVELDREAYVERGVIEVVELTPPGAAAPRLAGSEAEAREQVDRVLGQARAEVETRITRLRAEVARLEAELAEAKAERKRLRKAQGGSA